MEEKKDVYGCDGRNENCVGLIRYDDVNWFTSSIGFCNCCHDKLFSKIGDRYEELYNRCEANDTVAVDEVCAMTR